MAMNLILDSEDTIAVTRDDQGQSGQWAAVHSLAELALNFLLGCGVTCLDR